MKKILIGKIYKSVFLESLISLQLEPVLLEANAKISIPVQYHADMSVLKVNHHIFAADYLKDHINSFSDKYNITYIKQQSREYPKDCLLNLKIIGEYAVLNKRITPANIVNFLSREGFKILHVNQGYAGCSICVINERSVITSDHGIANVLQANGINVLEIKPGYITLEGYNYGFIGGSSINISEHQIAFSGSLLKHPEHSKIIEFINSEDCQISYLSNLDIFDFGSGIILNE